VGNLIGSKMTAISLLSGSNNNTIFNNSIGSECASVAYDWGANNNWDDGIAAGNRWSDYNGTGNYTVHGPAESIDHYPAVYELASPIDFSGPDIEFTKYLTGSTTADIWITTHFTFDPTTAYGLVSPRFEVCVTDVSPVDTVLFCYKIYGHLDDPWIIESMELMQSSGNESWFTFTLEGAWANIYLKYSVWANDTNGYSSATETLAFNLNFGIIYYTQPEPPIWPPEWNVTLFLTIIFFGSIILTSALLSVWCVYLWASRTRSGNYQ
jgi:hypothetical protein